jgi:hypothetical protein
MSCALYVQAKILLVCELDDSLDVGDVCAIQGVRWVASNRASLAARVHISGDA